MGIKKGRWGKEKEEQMGINPERKNGAKAFSSSFPPGGEEGKQAGERERERKRNSRRQSTAIMGCSSLPPERALAERRGTKGKEGGGGEQKKEEERAKTGNFERVSRSQVAKVYCTKREREREGESKEGVKCVLCVGT